MQDQNPKSVESKIIDNLLHLKNALKQSSEGVVLYRQIERADKERAEIHRFVEYSYLLFMRTLLQKYIKSSKSDPATRVKIILIQQQLQSYLTKIKKPSFFFVLGAREQNTLHGRAPQTEDFEQHIVSLLWSASAIRDENYHDDSRQSKDYWNDKVLLPEAYPDSPSSKLFQYNLDKNRMEIENFLESLDKHLSDTIAHNIDFTAHLKTVQIALQKTNDIEELRTLRQILIDAASELIQGHQWLSDSLHGAEESLGSIRSSNQRLHEDIGKVKQQTLVDEYTGMPNRIAFVRRLKAELGRARRYNYPLSVAIIDPDRFKEIDGLVGPGAGEAILKCYAEKILSQFRVYDVVARFGDYEFAVLLPNTEKEQALCALRKAQTRAAEAYYNYDGRKRSVPTFSSGLTRYAPGETPASLLARADKALTRARGLGRNRIEIELPRSTTL